MGIDSGHVHYAVSHIFAGEIECFMLCAGVCALCTKGLDKLVSNWNEFYDRDYFLMGLARIPRRF